MREYPTVMKAYPRNYGLWQLIMIHRGALQKRPLRDSISTIYLCPAQELMYQQSPYCGILLTDNM